MGVRIGKIEAKKLLINTVLLLIYATTMSQTIFNKTINKLYFNVEISNSSAEAIIDTLLKVKDLTQKGNAIVSMSFGVSLAMHNGKGAKKKTYVFSMLKSPLPTKNIDFGYIKIGVGEAGNIRKILDFEWCVQFNNKIDAENYFEDLKHLFIPIASNYRIENDERLPEGKYAEFSTREPMEKGIKDITFLFTKSVNISMYEIKLFFYNEFME